MSSGVCPFCHTDLSEVDRLREALAHAQVTVGLATSYIPAARFGEFVNRRAALAAQRGEEEK